MPNYHHPIVQSQPGRVPTVLTVLRLCLCLCPDIHSWISRLHSQICPPGVPPTDSPASADTCQKDLRRSHTHHGPYPASPFGCFVSWTQTLTPLLLLPLGKQTTWLRAGLCSMSAEACSEHWLCATTGIPLPCRGSRTEPVSRASVCSVAQGSTVALWLLSLSSSPSVLPGGGEI